MNDLRRVANWLLVGLLFRVLDFTIDDFDVIPDVVGALFIAIGAFIMVGSLPGDRAERAGVFVPILAVLAIVGTIAEIVAIFVLAGLWPFVHRVVLLFTVRRAAVTSATAERTPQMPLG